MTRIADPLREFTTGSIVYDLKAGVESFDEHAMREIVKGLDKVADQIDAEHARRMEQCRRGVRKDFARYMRSCIADYEKGISRRNRNHARARVTDSESDEATCTQCGSGVGIWDNYCCWCGAKITAREYVEAGDG
jgi:hypothetical protein